MVHCLRGIHVVCLGDQNNLAAVRARTFKHRRSCARDGNLHLPANAWVARDLWTNPGALVSNQCSRLKLLDGLLFGSWGGCPARDEVYVSARLASFQMKLLFSRLSGPVVGRWLAKNSFGGCLYVASAKVNSGSNRVVVPPWCNCTQHFNCIAPLRTRATGLNVALRDSLVRIVLKSRCHILRQFRSSLRSQCRGSVSGNAGLLPSEEQAPLHGSFENQISRMLRVNFKLRVDDTHVATPWRTSGG